MSIVDWVEEQRKHAAFSPAAVAELPSPAETESV